MFKTALIPFCVDFSEAETPCDFGLSKLLTMKKKYTAALIFVPVFVIWFGVIVWFVGLELMQLQACTNGYTGVVKFILDAGVSIDSRDGWNTNCMFYAAANGHVDTVRLLLDRGIDVNSSSRKNKTGLIIAAQRGEVDMVRFLLDQGADVQLKDEDSKTALDHAKEKEHIEVGRILSKSP